MPEPVSALVPEDETSAAWPPGAGEGFEPRLGDRAAFPRLRARAYWAHCAVSPPSQFVEAAATRALIDVARRGVTSFPTWLARREELRSQLAALVGAPDEAIALLANTSAGVTAVALGHPWRAGQAVVVLRGEFPTNVTPWLQAARAHDLAVRWLDVADFADPGGAGLERLEAALRAGDVGVVAVSAVQFQTGLRMPIEAMAALCHRHGAALFVDGIQGVGAVPLALGADGAPDAIDYLASGGHKWLMGLEGTGFIAIQPSRARALRPVTASWLSHTDGIGFLWSAAPIDYQRPLRPRADVLEGGVPNVAGFAALHAATALLQRLGVATIHAHIQALLDPLVEGLRARGFTTARSPDPARRSAIAAVRPPVGELGAWVAGLGERGVVVTAPDGWLRLAPHWPNAQAEVPELLHAVDELLRVGLPAASGPAAP
jgi:selenocysteine lyase/cysteine desulfurase